MSLFASNDHSEQVSACGRRCISSPFASVDLTPSSMFATSSSRTSRSRKTRRGGPFGSSIRAELRATSGFGGSGGGHASPRCPARCFARHMPRSVSASTPATSSMRRRTLACRSSCAVFAAASSGCAAWSMPTTQARFAATVQREPGQLAFAQRVPRAPPRTRRTHDGTVRRGESVPARALQVLGFALRETAWVSTNIRNCPGSVDRERAHRRLAAMLGCVLFRIWVTRALERPSRRAMAVPRTRGSRPAQDHIAT